MNRTIYGIDERVAFFTLEAAQDYLFEQYPEYCCGKEAMMDLEERMIWEDVVIMNQPSKYFCNWCEHNFNELYGTRAGNDACPECLNWEHIEEINVGRI